MRMLFTVVSVFLSLQVYAEHVADVNFTHINLPQMNSIEIEVDDYIRVTAERKTGLILDDQTRWHGTVKNDPFGMVHLVIQDGLISGIVNAGGHEYQVQIANNKSSSFQIVNSKPSGPDYILPDQTNAIDTLATVSTTSAAASTTSSATSTTLPATTPAAALALASGWLAYFLAYLVELIIFRFLPMM